MRVDIKFTVRRAFIAHRAEFRQRAHVIIAVPGTGVHRRRKPFVLLRRKCRGFPVACFGEQRAKLFHHQTNALAHEHRFRVFVGNVQRVVPIGVINFGQAVFADVFRIGIPLRRGVQMPRNAALSAVQIGVPFGKEGKIARFLYVLADGIHQPKSGVGIQLGIFHGIPKQDGRSVAVLVNKAFFDHPFGKSDVEIQDPRRKLCIVAHRFFSDRAITHLLFRPEIHQRIDAPVGTLRA